ncbi:MAG: hypothetical protein MZV63_60980 [Marinilabiliales bacterium]|nr:hypothetical protein [Marinilabiliales bacterium]
MKNNTISVPPVYCSDYCRQVSACRHSSCTISEAKNFMWSPAGPIAGILAVNLPAPPCQSGSSVTVITASCCRCSESDMSRPPSFSDFIEMTMILSGADE